jgi:hypothetical protein
MTIMRRSKRLWSSKFSRSTSRRNDYGSNRCRLKVEALEDRRLLSLSAGNLVWSDLNVNGVYDAGEPGVAGAVVEVFQSADLTVGNGDDVSCGLTTTDANGSYSLDGLVENANYYLRFRPPVGDSFTAQGAGDDCTLDSDTDSSGLTAMFTLAPDTDRTDLDAGLTGATPNFGFALGVGTTSSDYGQAIAADAAGNSYVTGYFQGTADFDPGPGVVSLTSSSTGYSAAFVAKYSSGGALCWARSIGGTANDYGYGIAVDTLGNVYSTGYFQGTADFDPGPGTANYTSAGSGDIFVLKLDPAGNFGWVRPIGGSAMDAGRGIALATDGGVCVTGYFTGTVNFGSADATLTGAGNADIFVMKLDASGTLAWARGMGGSSSDNGNAIAIATSGDIYTTGYFQGTADFDPGSLSRTLTATSYDIFVSKLDAAGNYVWARRLGGTSIDYGNGIALSADGVYTTGSFQLTADFDPGDATANLISAGNTDAFVSKLDLDGNYLWARALGAGGSDYGYGIAVDNGGNAYTVGYYQNTVDFDPGPTVFNLTYVGGSDVFVSELDAAGNFVQAASLGGTYSDFGYGIALAPGGSVNLTGTFYGTADFDPRAGVFNVVSANSSYDVFVAKIMPNHAPVDIGLSHASVALPTRRGVVVGQLNATDPDLNEAFVYDLLGAADSPFMLTGSRVRVADPTKIDPDGEYDIAVRVHDSFGFTFDKTLTIAVTNDPLCSVEGRAWNDLNGTGVQDDGEPGLAGAVAEIYQSSDAVVGNADDLSFGQAVADAAGNYVLTGLPGGSNYYLSFRPPVGYSFAPPNAGSDDTLDSDAAANGLTTMFALAPGDNRTDLDAGFSGAAPSFGMALNVGSTSSDYGQAVTVDAAGNIYVVGYFQGTGTVDFDPGPGVYGLTSPSSSNPAIVVAKFSSGGALCWASAMGGASADYGYRIAVDGSGNVFATGYYQGTVDFDPGPGTYNLSSNGYGDIFVVKLDAAGTFAWARGFGGSSSDTGRGMAATADGGVCFTGSYYGTVDFDPGPGTVNLTSAGGLDVFLAKLDSTGNLAWARSMGGSSGDDNAYGLAIDAAGGIYAAGSFIGTADFNPGSDVNNLVATGSGTDIFVVKLAADGTYGWASGMGGTSDDAARGIAVDGAGNVYTTGTFQGTAADFEPGAGTANLASAGGIDIFVAKLNAGGALVYARAMGGTNADYGNAIAVDADENAYTTGYFQGTADFDPGTVKFSLTSTNNAVFLSKLDAAGNFLQATAFGGTSYNYAFGYGIALSPDGGVVLTGIVNSTTDFDPRASNYNLVPSGSSNDIYIAKYLPDRAPTDVALSRATVPAHSLRGSTVGTLSASDLDANESFTYELTDPAGGRFMLSGASLQIDNAALLDHPGSYSVTVRARDSFGLAFSKTLTINVTDEPGCSVGDRVWNDANGNGIQDSGEAGIAGAVVELRQSADGTIGNADDFVLAQAITDAAGNYSIGGLVEGGNYYLVFRAPVGYTFTAQDAGGDDASDGDANASGITSFFALSPNTAKTDIDAGLTGSLPGFGYVFHAGNTTGSASAYAIALDSQGNAYVSGGMSGTLDVDPGPGVYNLAAGNRFIAKYSSEGALYWARAVNANSADTLAVASDGSVYFTGFYNANVDFDPGPGVLNLTFAGGNADIYFAKLDPAGNIAWVRSVGGTGYDSPHGIAVAADNSIYVTGQFQGTVDFDPGPGTSSLTSAGSNDIFLAKFTPDGNLLWVRGVGGTSSEDSYGVALAPNGNVCITGGFSGTVDFDPGAGTSNLTSASGDAFVAKFDADGIFVWARDMGGTGYSTNAYGRAIAIDGLGNIFTTGTFTGTIDFDPGPDVANLVCTYNPYSSDVTPDAFVSKLDSAGNFVWARSMGGTNEELPYGIAVAPDGGVYTIGLFNDLADFDPSPTRTFFLMRAGTDDSYNDIYLSKLDSAGNFASAARFGGTSNDYGYAAAVAGDGSIFLTGFFAYTADFDPRGSVYNVTTTGNNFDLFVEKLWANRAPTDIGISNASIPANCRQNSLVGQLLAVDPDPNETFTYEMINSADGRFGIDGASVRVANASLVDHPTTYNITVRARDYLGTPFDKTITITVTNDPTCSVGDRVWKDNGNGLQDAGESGIAGVVVEVFQSADAVIGNGDDFSFGSAVTNAAGNYTLGGLLPGDNYYLVFHVPRGYVVAPQDAGGNDAADSDASAAGVTGMFSLASAQNRTDLDTGLIGDGSAFGFALPVGASSRDLGRAITVDSAGNIYVAGTFTDTVDFDPGPGVWNLSNVKSGYPDLFVAKYTNAGSLCWVHNVGGTTDTEVFNLSLDANGNITTTATFQGTVDFDPGLGVFNMTAAGYPSPFVWKLDASGIFVSATQITVNCPGNWSSIVTTSDGSTYITGSFGGTVDFDPGPGTVEFTSLYGYSDIFVAKFDLAGNLVWARGMGGPTYDLGNDLAVAADGSVFVTGSFFRWASFGSIELYTEDFSSSWHDDAFVVKLSNAGNVVWAKNLGGPGDDVGTGIALGADGGIYTTGTCYGVADFDPGSATHTIGDETQLYTKYIFVSKLDSGGNYLQAVGLSGGDSAGGRIAVDSNGNTYLTGSFGQTTDFNPRGGQYNLTSAGDWDAFVAKLNADAAPSTVTFAPVPLSPTITLGAVVGELSATDADAGENFTYEFAYNPGNLFTITDSLIRVASSTVVAGDYSVSVRVRDSFGAKIEKYLTIAVRTTNPRCWVSGQVWNDLNANGLQDEGEPGIAGAVVEACRSRDAVADNGDDFSWAVAVADASGNYVLDGLASGVNYYLIFRPPVGSYAFTSPNAGDDGLDSDGNAFGVTSIFTLSAGENRADMDAGLTGAAPETGFAYGGVGSSIEDGYGGRVLAVDASGNIYAGGSADSYSDFDPGPRETPLASFGGYLAKYTATGALVWVRTLRGNSRVQALALAADGGIVAGGGFAETADFDPGRNANNLTSSASSWDIFLMKFDAAGYPVWVRQMGNIDGDSVTGLALDTSGNIFAAGNFSGTVDFDPGAGVRSMTSRGFDPNAGVWTDDVFVLKLDSSGNFSAATSWVKQLGGTGDDYPTGLALGTDGSIHTAGTFSGTADFDPGTATKNLIANGYSDIFVSKLTSAGAYVWARGFGGTSDDYGHDLAVDSSGSVYVTGEFRETVDFDPSAGVSNVTAVGSNDGFALKLTSNGEYGWACGFGGTGFDEGTSVAVGADGRVYLGGTFQYAADFDPSSATFRLAAPGYSGYLVQLDSAGHFGWATCTSGNVTTNDILVPVSGNVFTTGTFFVAMMPAVHVPTSLALSANTVPEHCRQGTVIGQLSAVDPDFGDTLTYQLLDSAGGRFKITGTVLQVANGNLLDYDDTSYNVTVRVRDSFGTSSDRVFNIAVTQESTALAGDRAWFDSNGNGVQDDGEPGASGVVVEAFQSLNVVAGDADDVSLGQIATDGNGRYVFTGLKGGGNYYLVFHTPTGCSFIAPHAGGDGALDSDVDALGKTAMFIVAAGDERTDLDAGLSGQIPNFGFALRVGGTSAETGDSVAVDAAGNVYVAGDFSGTVDFDQGPGVSNLSGANGNYAFVAKYSQTGALYWAHNFPGRTDMCRFGVAVASDGSVFLNGTFSFAADFDPGPGEYLVAPSEYGGSDIYTLKLDADGNFAWARSLQSSYLSQVNGIGATPDNGVVTTGKLGDNGIIWKLDSAGNDAWKRTMSTSFSPVSPRGEPNGDVVVTGYFGGTVDFDPGSGTYNLSSKGNNDAFVLDLDSAGNFRWARSLGGTAYDYGWDAAVAPDNSVYIAGQFSGTADFDPGTGIYNVTAAGNGDAFVEKLDANGNFLWVRNLGAPGAACNGRGIAISPEGGIYTTGSFTQTVDFDPGSQVFALTASGTSAFVWHLSPSGDFGGAFSAAVSSSGASIAAGTNESVYTTGSFSGTGDFDPGPNSYNLTSLSTDIFLWKLRTNHAPVASAGGPYSVGCGQALALDASQSADPDGMSGDYIVSYAWDLGNDGVYELSGVSPSLTWAQLSGLPFNTDIPLRLLVTDRSGAMDVATTVVRLVVPPPSVAGVVIGDGTAQRSMVTVLTVTFSTLVSLDGDAFELRRTSDNALVTLSETIAEVGGRTQVTLCFNGDPTEYGSLADGNYQLIVHGDQVHDVVYGLALDGDYVFGDQLCDAFFRFFGDSDGDRDVDNLDFARFRNSYNTLSGDSANQACFDNNADGAVDNVDFAAFRLRYPSRLPSDVPAGNSANLTLTVGGDGLVHVYHTGTTIDALPPIAHSAASSASSPLSIPGQVILCDALTVDFTHGNPISAGGVNFSGGTLLVLGGPSDDEVLMTASAITINGSAPLYYNGTSDLAFDLGGGENSFVLRGASFAFARDNAISAGTNVTVEGGTLDFQNHSSLLGRIAVTGGGQIDASVLRGGATTVESGVVTADSIVCDSLVIGAPQPPAAAAAGNATSTKNGSDLAAVPPTIVNAATNIGSAATEVREMPTVLTAAPVETLAVTAFGNVSTPVIAATPSDRRQSPAGLPASEIIESPRALAALLKPVLVAEALAAPKSEVGPALAHVGVDRAIGRVGMLSDQSCRDLAATSARRALTPAADQNARGIAVRTIVANEAHDISVAEENIRLVSGKNLRKPSKLAAAAVDELFAAITARD